MLEELIRKGVAAAKASGRRGWVLIRLDDMSIVGAFESPDKAKRAAESPGLYLLIEIG
ncbi:MAG: hypothetical protein TU35_004355 [Thermoproteus sp. AZ2]|jgi:hypothetical protein|uniref:Uncharacterized protein n=1 Tax=Thermoproteus sp. AZ2 TaxID=1609232 RepID=A0ACC6V0F2_9CREN